MSIWNGENVRRLRERKKLSQKELGMMLGYAPTGAQSNIALWERKGVVPVAKFEQLDMINKASIPTKEHKKEPNMARKKSLNLVKAVEKVTNLPPEKIAAMLGCNSKRAIKAITTGGVTGKLPDTVDTLMRVLLNVCYAVWPNKIDLSTVDDTELNNIYTEYFSLKENVYTWVEDVLNDTIPEGVTSAPNAAPIAAPVKADDTHDVHKVAQAKTGETITLEDGTVIDSDTGELVNELNSIINNPPAPAPAPAFTPAPAPAPVEPTLPMQPVSISTPVETPAPAPAPAPTPTSAFTAPMPMPTPPMAPAPAPAPEPTVLDLALRAKPRTQEFLMWFVEQPDTQDWLTHAEVTPEQINECLDVYSLLEPALKTTARRKDFLMWYVTQPDVMNWLNLEKLRPDLINESLNTYSVLQPALARNPRSMRFISWFIAQPNVKAWVENPSVTADAINTCLNNYETSYRQMFPNG